MHIVCCMLLHVVCCTMSVARCTSVAVQLAFEFFYELPAGMVFSQQGAAGTGWRLRGECVHSCRQCAHRIVYHSGSSMPMGGAHRATDARTRAVSE